VFCFVPEEQHGKIKSGTSAGCGEKKEGTLLDSAASAHSAAFIGPGGKKGPCVYRGETPEYDFKRFHKYLCFRFCSEVQYFQMNFQILEMALF